MGNNMLETLTNKLTLAFVMGMIIVDEAYHDQRSQTEASPHQFLCRLLINPVR